MTELPENNLPPTLPEGAELARLDSPPEAPELEGYKIVRKLGEGGMGTVWLAVQLSTYRVVALKMLSPAAFGSDSARARFEREVSLTARLEHPNIARLYDSGVWQGIYCYAMEWIDGVALDDYVSANELDSRAIVELMATVASAVDYAHQRGVIHTDLKPSNVIVSSDGQPHILDFGLAKKFGEDDAMRISLTNQVMGTPAFMSPEQARGQRGDLNTRTDVYSLGVMLFLSLTGKFPHDVSGSYPETIRRICEEEPRSPREFAPRISRDLEAIIMKSLAHDSLARYANAGELAADLSRFLQGEPVEAKPPTVFGLVTRRVRRHRMSVGFGAAMLIVAAVAVGVTYWTVQSRTAPAPSVPALLSQWTPATNDLPVAAPARVVVTNVVVVSPAATVGTNAVAVARVKEDEEAVLRIVETLNVAAGEPSGVRGLAWDGESFWLSAMEGAGLCGLLHYSRKGELLKTLPVSKRGQLCNAALAFDGEQIAGICHYQAGRAELVRYDRDGRFVNARDVATELTLGLAWTGEGYLCASGPVKTGPSVFVQFDGAGRERRRFEEPFPVFSLAWDGEHLWALSFEKELRRRLGPVRPMLSSADGTERETIRHGQVVELDADGRLLRQFRTPVTLAAVTWADGALWGVERGAGKLHRFALPKLSASAEQQQRVQLDLLSAEFQNRQRVADERKLITELNSALAAYWPGYDFAGALARCEQTGGQLRTDEGRAEFEPVAGPVRLLAEFKSQLAEDFAAAPFDAQAFRTRANQPIPGRLSKTTATEITCVLPYGETRMAWGELAPATLAGIGEALLKTAGPATQGRRHLALAAFARQYGLGAVADAHLREAARLLPAAPELKWLAKPEPVATATTTPVGSNTTARAAMKVAHPLARWSLKEGRGLVAKDSSGNGNDAALQGGVTWMLPGSGGGLRFDGRSGFLTVADRATQSGMETLSIAGRFQVHQHPMRTVALMRKWSATAQRQAFRLEMDPEGRLRFEVRTGGGVLEGCDVQTPVVPLNVWVELVAVFDGTRLRLHVKTERGEWRTTEGMRAPESLRGPVAKVEGEPVEIGCDREHRTFLDFTLDWLDMDDTPWNPPVPQEGEAPSRMFPPHFFNPGNRRGPLR